MPFRRQTEAARSGEAERARIARNLADHTGEIAALHPLLQCEQGVFRRGGRDMDQTVAQIARQALKTGPPAKLDCLAVLYPQHLAAILDLGRLVPARGRQRIARQRQRQCHPARFGPGGKDLGVQRLPGKAGPPPRLRACQRENASFEGRRSAQGKNGLGHGHGLG